MATTLRFVLLVAAFGGLLIPLSAFAQKEQGARAVRLDEGINVRVAPTWKARTFAAGTTRLEFTVDRRRRAAHGRLFHRREAGGAFRTLFSGRPRLWGRRRPRIGSSSSMAGRPWRPRGRSSCRACRTNRKAGEGGPVPKHPTRGVTFERTITAIAAGTRTVIIEQRLYDRADQRLRDAGREVVGQVTFTREWHRIVVTARARGGRLGAQEPLRGAGADSAPPD